MEHDDASTPVVPAADPLDVAAAEQLIQQSSLHTARARAEKWIGGVSALSGVLGTALVIKGPADVTKITLGWRIAVGAVLAAAISLLMLAAFRGYRAAFGGAVDEREPEILLVPLAGLRNRVRMAERVAAEHARRDLAAAVRSALVAIPLIAIAVGITWFAPTTSYVCIYANGHVVARVRAEASAVTTTSPGTTVTPCA